MNTDDKSCQNCKYFIQHYAFFNLRYAKINCGHCINHNYKTAKRSLPKLCEFWERSDEVETRKKKIEEAIMLMSENLNQMLQILQEETET